MQVTNSSHIEPIVLWQSLCGGRELRKSDYQHVITCLECDKLAEEITDALDDIEVAFNRLNGRPSKPQQFS